MRWLVLSLLPFAAFAQASISGKVTNGLTGEPIRKASVVLERCFQTGRDYLAGAAVTEASGSYSIAKLPPGTYCLDVRRTGFLDEHRSEAIELRADEEFQADLTMTPWSVVTGRVLDEDGEPVPGAEVCLHTYTVSAAKSALNECLTRGPSAESDDLGQYRIFGIPAGRYYVSVDPHFHDDPDDEDGTALAGSDYTRSYYPDALDLSAAARITVSKGSTIAGIDFRLRKRRTYSIRGKVVADKKLGFGRSTVTCSRNGRSFRRVSTGPDGTFRLSGLPAGTYGISAQEFAGDVVYAGGREVSLLDSDLTDVAVALAPGGFISGVVRVDEEVSNLKPGGVRFTLVFDEPRFGFDWAPVQARPSDDGEFEMHNVLPERARIFLFAGPQNVYVKSARSGSRDLLESPADYSELHDPIEIVLSNKTGAISGNVTDDKGNPVSHAIVAPVCPELAERVLPGLTDEQGHYSIENVPPGSYKLFAFLEADMGTAGWNDPEFLAQNLDRAASVIVGESEKLSRDLKLIPVWR